MDVVILVVVLVVVIVVEVKCSSRNNNSSGGGKCMQVCLHVWYMAKREYTVVCMYWRNVCVYIYMCMCGCEYTCMYIGMYVLGENVHVCIQ